MYGHTLGAAVALGYVVHAHGCTDQYLLSGHYEIRLASRKVPAKISIAPMYDPKSVRVRT
jgi:4-methylaminobutanoate oxidase (formaldehyde-forming)